MDNFDPKITDLKFHINKLVPENMCKYFINFYEDNAKYSFVETSYKYKTNKIENWIIEIKPYKFTKEPIPQKRKTRKYINEVKNYAINSYKWDAAKYFCKKRDWKFKILTENELHIKG